MKIKESDIQKSIIDYLRLRDFIVFKHHSTGFKVVKGKAIPFKYGDRGISDIIGLSNTGQFIAIEVKRKGRKPSTEQIDFLKKVKEHKGISILAYSLDDVMQVL